MVSRLCQSGGHCWRRRFDAERRLPLSDAFFVIRTLAGELRTTISTNWPPARIKRNHLLFGQKLLTVCSTVVQDHEQA
ncbi:unnamed protein product [Closterium sp. NIES-53]